MGERRLFGTDGIRGRATVAPVTPELALRLGRAITLVARRDGTDAPRIVIGKDTRGSCYMETGDRYVVEEMRRGGYNLGGNNLAI